LLQILNFEKNFAKKGLAVVKSASRENIELENKKQINPQTYQHS
jgi:hypothetical protein